MLFDTATVAYDPVTFVVVLVVVTLLVATWTYEPLPRVGESVDLDDVGLGGTSSF